MFGWLRKLVGGKDPKSQAEITAEPTGLQGDDTLRFNAEAPARRERPPPRCAPISLPPPEAQVIREFFNSVSGVTYANPDGTSRQLIIRYEVRTGMPLMARFENDNPVDQNAVALFIPNGHQIGYLNQRTAMDVRDYIARGEWLQITVSATTGGTLDRPTYGVNILLKVLATPAELPMRTADFRKAVAAAKREGQYQKVEAWLLQDVAEREKPSGAVDTVVSSWPYEQLANLYRQQKRWADEIAILTRYLALPEIRRVASTERLQHHLDKAAIQLTAGSAIRSGLARRAQG
ncbi:MAG TPA: HIRAN domain-containing protein [Acetobacteraceae bacterium]